MAIRRRGGGIEMRLQRACSGLASRPRGRNGLQGGGRRIHTRARIQEGAETLELHVGGGTLRFETGEVGRQANGAVVATAGETVRGTPRRAFEQPWSNTTEEAGREAWVQALEAVRNG
eukprot:scaffold282_cov345-Pavlova_lutheri.AAC.39